MSELIYDTVGRENTSVPDGLYRHISTYSVSMFSDLSNIRFSAIRKSGSVVCAVGEKLFCGLPKEKLLGAQDQGTAQGWLRRWPERLLNITSNYITTF